MNIINQAKISNEISFYIKIEITVYFVLIKLQKLACFEETLPRVTQKTSLGVLLKNLKKSCFQTAHQNISFQITTFAFS